jgi:hypothetical protein
MATLENGRYIKKAGCSPRIYKEGYKIVTEEREGVKHLPM